ncbi:hypothetical protein LELG_00541 [Lodderomyces elongisporus NRRL YB-4239]|uniref:F-box domain-containing protein n=1 Tax=Lodderomyces elongisporus (strain ATCC 11503 / CBS 2605 / JCM 1781 / NBRC 1676 / NRRL YB-4239) TaxID=379508 RepID=A5DT55_LODEL|nr:hypothetical protein LELG_00541 [Lodderomyces elongisporus NRRL YB-4239]
MEMISAESIDFHHHLPPYRSLLNPNARYDYRSHQLVPLTQNDLNLLQSVFRNNRMTNTMNNNNTTTTTTNNNQYKNKNKNTIFTRNNRRRNESKNTNLKSQTEEHSTSNEHLKMKYRSLLNDVGRSLTLKLSNNNLLGNVNQTTSSSSASASASSSSSSSSSGSLLNSSAPLGAGGYGAQQQGQGQVESISRSSTIFANHFLSKSSTLKSIQIPHRAPKIKHVTELPIEILNYIFQFIDNKEDYKCCLLTCKLFYQLAKPYYYANLSFSSTFRLAQFVTYLRCNPEVGQYVLTIDLSDIKPGLDENEESAIREADEHNQNHNHNNNHNNNHNINGVGEGANANEAENIPNPSLSSASTKPFGHNRVLAGWRDWKFKNNPLYTVHPAPLMKIASSSQISVVSSKSNSSHKSSSSSSPKRLTKPFKYFKARKRSKSFSGFNEKNSGKKTRPRLEVLKLQMDDISKSARFASPPHPTINKFLLNYASSKDVPVGYVVHIINLCPNVVSLNLGNLSLSTDYEISRKVASKFQTFDLLNNYPRDLVHRIDQCMNFHNGEADPIGGTSSANASTINGKDNLRQIQGFKSSFFRSRQMNVSSASSVYSMTTFSKPIRKYNSLLPPLPSMIADISYLKRGDGKVFLSDLNLKSINHDYLRKVDEHEILSAIATVHGRRGRYHKAFQSSLAGEEVFGGLLYLNMSSMIWLNRLMIEKFLINLLTYETASEESDDHFGQGLNSQSFDDDNYTSGADSYSNSGNGEGRYSPTKDSRLNLVIDFSDSGMYKNLIWAQEIDLRTETGCKLANQIIRNELLTPQEEELARERERRGRMGENYLA